MVVMEWGYKNILKGREELMNMGDFKEKIMQEKVLMIIIKKKKIVVEEIIEGRKKDKKYGKIEKKS